MKNAMLIMLLYLAGCASLAKYEEPTKKGITQARAYAQAVDPLTGGWASPVVGGAGTIAGLVFGINRALLAKKHAKVIKNIDSNPDTPKAVDQVTKAKDQQIIIKIVGENNV